MADEANRTNGLFLPWPLLGLIMTLTLTLGGGLIGMYVKLDTMNATMLMRDADHRDAVKRLESKLDLQEMYTKDIREKLVEVRTELNQQKRRTN